MLTKEEAEKKACPYMLSSNNTCLTCLTDECMAWVWVKEKENYIGQKAEKQQSGDIKVINDYKI